MGLLFTVSVAGLLLVRLLRALTCIVVGYHSGSTSCLKRGCWPHYPSLGSRLVVLGVDSGSHTIALTGVDGVVEEDQNPTD